MASLFDQLKSRREKLSHLDQNKISDSRYLYDDDLNQAFLLFQLLECKDADESFARLRQSLLETLKLVPLFTAPQCQTLKTLYIPPLPVPTRLILSKRAKDEPVTEFDFRRETCSAAQICFAYDQQTNNNNINNNSKQ